VAGVSISNAVPDRVARTGEVMAESCEHLDMALADAAPVIWGGYVGSGYGMPHGALDAGPGDGGPHRRPDSRPCLPAKALGGLIGEIEAHRVKRDDLVVFIDTGGAPTLFADPALYWWPD
jgi:1-aminocyclopropane-1-carboxylate deaminase/D-cysteine desulfhydrase-like pyridoxal-dependent ACC family enzyme